MNLNLIVEFINLFFVGILAGSLFVIHYGVQTSLSTLDERPQIQMRQALIYKLRVLVPALFIPAILSGIAVAVLGGSAPGPILRTAGVLVLMACFLLVLTGTAPINAAVLSWQLDTPPQDWRMQISRWERLDSTRTWTAAASFVLMLAAIAVQLASR